MHVEEKHLRLFPPYAMFISRFLVVDAVRAVVPVGYRHTARSRGAPVNFC